MPTSLPPPQQRPEPLTLVLKGLKVVVPPAGIVAIAVLLTPGLAYMVLPDSNIRSPENGPIPAPVPQVGLQASTYSAFPQVVAMLGRLPDGVDTQRKPPCDPDAEEAIGGWCWIPLDVEKCPTEKGKAFKHEGKCYLRALRAARSPTTGDPGTLPVAVPAE